MKSGNTSRGPTNIAGVTVAAAIKPEVVDPGIGSNWAWNRGIATDPFMLLVETDQKEGFANTRVGNGREDLAACNK